MREYLKNHILIGDGAMGTYLYQLGTPVGMNFEELNLTNPELIANVHRQYIAAGAKLIQTNTYMANREKLARFGLEDKLKEINRAAVRIAKQAANSDVFVAGTIGGMQGLRGKEPDLKEITGSVQEQLEVFLEENVDAVLFETYLDLEELLAVLKIARQKTDLPIICQLSRYEGLDLRDAFTQLKDEGADVVGLNCRTGPHKIIKAFERVPLLQDVYFSAYPNAGLPDYVDGRYEYESTPEYFAKSALRLREQGVRLIGGCCGTTPDHIRKIAQALKDLSPVTEKLVANSKDEKKRLLVGENSIPNAESTRRWMKPTLPECIQRRHTVIVELDPPRNLDYKEFLYGCQALKDAGADAVTLADNSLAMMRMSNMALGTLVKERIGIRPLLHVACRDRNLIAQQSHLMGLHALGIDHVLVVTGDPTRFGDFPGATSVYDLNSFEMIRLIKEMNKGISYSGQPLGSAASFIVGGAFNPNVKNLDKAIERLEKKVAAGADYIMTQPVYSTEQVEELYQATKHIEVPIFVGVMPLTSSRNAEFLHNEVPGIRLSDKVRERMSRVNGEAARREGVEIAREIVDAIIERFNGVYLITPFLRYEMTAELTKYIVKKTSPTFGRSWEVS
ncbi:MAG: putative 5,10-methylenetetrahydrofolate reductase [Clostridiales bacterium]|jgi:homocysteine S-methyltransferase|nr:putative 5,10-methylenetetrahydrofolate reductase [Clostridiales bacterium]